MMIRMIWVAALMLLTTVAAAESSPKGDWAFAKKRLLKAGFNHRFVANLGEHYTSEKFNEVVELNTLLFLRKTDYHAPQVTPEATAAVRSFVAQNTSVLQAAQKRYAVEPEVIASLLWIESRHGQNQGEFHVPSVFVDLLQANRPDVIKHLYTAAGHYSTKKVRAKDRREIATRAAKRVKWAMGELRAIQTMYKQDPTILRDFRGSFAGAFGMPQFEPSSYVHYAKPADNSRPADLERADDAIMSVAYYLKTSGWRAKRGHVKALMKYNNSHDYANAILKLAAQAKSGDRLPAGQ